MNPAKNIVIVTVIAVTLVFLQIWLTNSQYKRVQMLIESKFEQQSKEISALFEDTTFTINLTQ